MKSLIVVTCIILLIVFSQTSYSQQDVELKKNEFKLENKQGFDEAWDEFKQAEDLYRMNDRLAYYNARGHYIKAYKYNSNNAVIDYKLAVCYLFSEPKATSLKYFEDAYKINPNVASDILFFLGRAKQLNYKFKEAIDNYNEYENILTAKDKIEKSRELEKLVKECKNGIELMARPARVFIDNIGENMNTKYSEHSPVIITDESAMYFTSRREGTTGGDTDPQDDKYYEDIYVSNNVNGLWQQAHNVGKPLNTKENDATIGLTPDGRRMLIYKGSRGYGDIYESYLKGDEWSSPKSLPSPINSKNTESSASFSYNEFFLFFTSDKEGSLGKSDIFISQKNVKGKWMEPVNIGPEVNTPYREEGVFLLPDGRTLFFSSEGLNSMGGLDIFKTTLDSNGNWTPPVNLGYPINTPEDDVFFVMAANGKTGYMASSRPGGFGDADIYKIIFLDAEKPTLQSNDDNLMASIANPVSEANIQPKITLNSIQLTILKGKVRDKQTLKPIEAEIEIVDNQKDQIISQLNSNSQTGNYLIPLPSGKNYGIAVKAPYYMFHSENFDIPSKNAFQEIIKDIDMVPVDVGSKIILKNVFFDIDKYFLRPESFTELNRIVDFLNDYSKVRIEISGHTDNTGTKEINDKLSFNRAKAVVEYIVSKGIDPKRLEYKGFAETQPIATNDTPEGKQLNRRVESKILKK